LTENDLPDFQPKRYAGMFPQFAIRLTCRGAIAFMATFLNR
jgi:hypothetical protein